MPTITFPWFSKHNVCLQHSRIFPATCASCPRREARVTLSERKPPWRLCCQTPTCASCPRREAQVEPNPAKCVETMKMKILWQHIARTLQYTRLLQNLVSQASQKRVLRFLSACFCGQTRSFQTYALNILESLYKFQPAKGWKAMVKHLQKKNIYIYILPLQKGFG